MGWRCLRRALFDQESVANDIRFCGPPHD